MKRNHKRLLPYGLLAASLLALLVVFVAFMLRDDGTKNELVNAGNEIVETASESVTTEDNLDSAEPAEEQGTIEKETELQEDTLSEDEEKEDSLEVKEQAQTDNEAVELAASDSNTDDQANADSLENADSDSQEENTGNDQALPEENAETVNQEQVAAEAPAAPVETPHTGGHLVVIDPGHQSRAMTDKEPNGPGSSNMKMKVTAGTVGKTTGLAESQLNLTVGLMLRDELQNRGYTVMMTRESQDVSLSNVDRAQLANNAGAEAFIRIHANGSDDTSVNGALTICQTASNPYNGGLYGQSRKLSDCVLEAYCNSTGFKKQYVWETDTMTGINWANVPSTIIEMGYMSNPTDDTNMASPDYQRLMAIGIANGIDNYFAQ